MLWQGDVVPVLYFLLLIGNIKKNEYLIPTEVVSSVSSVTEWFTS